MMEAGEIGIKDADDVWAALEAGYSAVDLHASYGERVAGLLAVVLDRTWAFKRKLELTVDDIDAERRRR